MLSDREWEEFYIGGNEGIFDISSTSSGIDKNKLITSDHCHLPYITRTDINNGVNQFLSDDQKEKYCIDEGNVITIGLDTQTVFYQAHKFFTGQNIQVMRHQALNKHNALFLIPLIKVQMEKFNWGGNGATLGRLFRTKLMLTIDDHKNPDWAFMEQYAKAIVEKKVNIYKQYIMSVLSGLECKEIQNLEELEWDEFEIGKLFKLQTGKSKGLNHLEKTTNGINYLGATNRNNGVLCQVKNDDKMIQKGNCIAFIRNGEGSMGYAIYKSENFIATSDITVGYADFLNRYIGLFITTVSDKIRGKYNFGYKRSDTRLKKEKILLPTNNKGEPDYEYMEQYIKNIKYNKIKQYLKYLESKS
jgi:hypothetical protein